jgi:EAL domain-containing protein (putative c-di-GMP-specific phosphodiesterase class I)
MSVNVSSRQFLHPSFTALVRNVLNETGMDPTLLELEITERTAMTDVDHAVHVLHELRDLGVRTAIDDFGVGYS